MPKSVSRNHRGAAGVGSALQIGHDENGLRGIAYKEIGPAAGQFDANPSRDKRNTAWHGCADPASSTRLLSSAARGVFVDDKCRD
jgi:hypothetical protein